ncbi:MAG: helix-turn-helix transcriptional regulator [Alphaproteobacteria bacterium]|nr:helix-turn-helix transcriptional regulator [Alphaproteobacteria bacterium]
MKAKDLSKNPVEITLSMLNTKWKPLIIQELLSGTKRFLELKNSVGKITQKVLTVNLREMEEKGLVERKVYKEIPPRVEYTLTDLGYSLATVLEPMAEWGSAYKELLKIIEKQQKKSQKQHQLS